MYWTRDVLYFFGIKNEDINIFLNIHQLHKFSLTKKVSLRSFSGNYNLVNDRTGSYWARGQEEDQQSRSFRGVDEDMTANFMAGASQNFVNIAGDQEDSKSFRVNIGQYVVQNNYLYNDADQESESSLNFDMNRTKVNTQVVRGMDLDQNASSDYRMSEGLVNSLSNQI